MRIALNALKFLLRPIDSICSSRQTHLARGTGTFRFLRLLKTRMNEPFWQPDATARARSLRTDVRHREHNHNALHMDFKSVHAVKVLAPLQRKLPETKLNSTELRVLAAGVHDTRAPEQSTPASTQQRGLVQCVTATTIRNDKHKSTAQEEHPQHRP